MSPIKGQGGCGSLARAAAPIDAYITALVIADHQRIASLKVEELPPWPKEKELAELQGRIDEAIRRYEVGEYSAEHHFPSLARMETTLAGLRREQRKYNARQDARKNVIANLTEEWEKPSFTMEQRQAAIARTLTAVVIGVAGKGVRFHPDQLTPIFRQEP